MDNNKKSLTQKQKDVLEVLEKSMGIISTACKKCNIARSTFYLWVDTNSTFAEAVKDVNELALDMAETKLYTLISEKNITAIIFYLKNKGKSRGYQNEIDGGQNTAAPQKIEISILNPNKEGTENANPI